MKKSFSLLILSTLFVSYTSHPAPANPQSYQAEAEQATDTGNYDKAISITRDRIRNQENRASLLIRLVSKTTPPALTQAQLTEICRITSYLQGNPRDRVEDALGDYQTRTGIRVPCKVNLRNQPVQPV